jgi:replicative DNA helicase
VLRIYFEDDNVDIVRKHFSKITQTEARMIIKDKEITKQIKEQLHNYKDRELMHKNLRIKRFNTGTKRASDIENYIKKLRNRGFSPDLVIIDYFECLIPEKTAYNQEKDYTRDAITMRKIENMAKNLNIAIWIPTQGNRGSVTSTDVVTMDQVGGSFTKAQICQVVISIARSLEDVDKNKATLAVLKNRNGKSGAVFEGIRYDNGTATISCDEVETFDTAMTYFERVEDYEERKIKEQNELLKQVRKNCEADEFADPCF